MFYYRCLASNEFGEESAQCNLTVDKKAMETLEKIELQKYDE